jgi:iron complex outermembrane receptor protein
MVAIRPIRPQDLEVKKRKARGASWLALLSVSLTGTASHAQEVSAPAHSENEPGAEVVVTGSRIPNAVGQIPTDVTVITSQDLEDRGFKNVFDALNTLTQNTGFTQGADFGNTFTPAANTISLRGLGPNHTLILIDGRRVADYPVAYDGSVNFVNIANIPSAAIDRIEILSGGASAIYGSDAVAGVVNIILKDHAQGLDVNVKAGMTQHGGGGNGRLQLVGGQTFDKLTATFAVEISRIEPIWAANRDIISSNTLAGESPQDIWGRQDLTTGNYLNPADGCAAFSKLFSHGVSPYDTGSGTYCGSGTARPTYWTVQTGNQSENFYGRLKYQLNEKTQLFGDVLLGWNDIWNNTREPTWISNKGGAGYFLNQNTGDYEQWVRAFAPEEMGGVDQYNREWREFSVITTAGIQGDIGSSTWKYEAAYSGSAIVSHDEQPHLLAGIDSYFLGPQLGVDSSGVPIYAPDPSRFNQPLTATQFDSLLGHSVAKNNSWLQTITASANGELAQLPAGPLGTAAALEWGTQGFSNKPDPAIAQGIFYNTGVSAKASGSRSRYAAALEFKVPLLTGLEARLAGRYDEYSFEGRSEGKPTYHASLDYKPIEAVRLHASYATSFRAPDMNYIYQSRVLGYEASTTDYYRCGLLGGPLASCPYANMSPGANFIQGGSRDLGFENGRSFDYGVVITPVESLELSVDYWNIRIDNEVALLDADLLLRTEAACRLGTLNISSSQCEDALSRIERNPPNAILNPNGIVNILISPVNASYERTDGMDFGARFKWHLAPLGDFAWTANYTRVMSHYFKQFPGDTPLDLIRSFDNPNSDSDFPDKLTTTLTWALGNLSSTVEVDRFGSIINQAQTAFLTPTSLVNWSAQYRLGNATVAVILNNLFDTIKQDASAGWPYYPVGYYFPYAREGWLEFSYHFGG